ncbi:MAG: hypothetical protein K1X66_09245 [Verrucomicrobiae bacterium]|nr:hypothetical protein [Verrucomicrobiae bacterium]
MNSHLSNESKKRGYEIKDFNIRFVIIFVLLLVMGIALVYGATTFLLKALQKREKKEEFFSKANKVQRLVIPRLQVFPKQDMQKFLEKERIELNGYGWVDREKGIVQIPIEQSMKWIVDQGLPIWPSGEKVSTFHEMIHNKKQKMEQ